MKIDPTSLLSGDRTELMAKIRQVFVAIKKRMNLCLFLLLVTSVHGLVPESQQHRVEGVSSSLKATVISERPVIARARTRTFLEKSIKQPDPVPQEGIEAAVACMQSGKLFRYNLNKAEESEVSKCEAELCEYTGHKFALGLNSCGTAIFLSLVCSGAVAGDKVLTNGFTFTAVPSAIVHAGCEPVYVEANDSLCVELEDLERKMDANPDAKYFIVSHMRGKIADMDAIKKACDSRGVVLLEDCAHSLGVLYKGKHTGHHGKIASFSSQSYKMLNSGEGGFFLTDDDFAFAKAMAYAGAYETLAQKHAVRPSQEALDDAMDGSIPNYSLRMHEATAAMLRPQILTIDQRREQYNSRYYDVAERISSLHTRITVPVQLPEVTIVGDSVQFFIDFPQRNDADTFVDFCEERGLPVERFGSKTNARNFENWKYAKQPLCGLPATKDIISKAFDVRLPLVFDDNDVDKIVDIIAEALDDTLSSSS